MADYWIAPGGDNSWSGLDDQNPWATPLYTNAQLSAGDTVWVMEGSILSAGTADWASVPSGASWATSTKFRGVPGVIAGFHRPISDSLGAQRIIDLPVASAYVELFDLFLNGNGRSNDAVRLGAGSSFIRLTRVHTQGTWNHGCQTGSSQNCEFYSCKFTEAGSPGEASYGVYNQDGPNFYYDCEFIDCGSIGISMHSNGDVYAGNILERCRFIRCGAGFNGADVGSTVVLWNTQSSAHTFRNNIFWDNRRPFSAGGGSDGHFIYNNTIYTTALEGILIQSGSDNLNIRNNILLDIGTTAISDSGSGNTTTPNLTTGTPTNIFRDPANGDFRLLASDTLARGQGVDLSGSFTGDYIGRTRVAWDHGAYEYAVALGGSVRTKHFMMPALAGIR